MFIKISPLTSIKVGVFADFLSCNGIALIVLTLCVISSPLNPSPLVKALSSIPFLYINETPKPSIFGSATKSTSELFSHFFMRL